MLRTRIVPPLLLVGLLVSACIGGADPAGSPTPLATPTPSPTAEATPSPTPSATDSPSAEPTPTPVTSGPPGGFAVLPNTEADELFLDRDECMNERDSYSVEFPDDWWTNTAFGNGRYPACIWFSPTSFEVDDSDEVPSEIAIVIEWVPGDVGSHDADIVSSQEVVVGGQPATRVEWDDESYWYVIQLGPTLEEGPNLWVRTSSEMGGDYELNRAVMDRMMATMEFFGSTQ